VAIHPTGGSDHPQEALVSTTAVPAPESSAQPTPTDGPTTATDVAVAATARAVEPGPDRRTPAPVVNGLSLALAAAAALGGFALGTVTAPLTDRAKAPAGAPPAPAASVPMNPDAAEQWLTPARVPNGWDQGMPRVIPTVSVPTSPDAAERWLTRSAPAAPEPVTRPTSADAAERWFAECMARAPRRADPAEWYAATCW